MINLVSILQITVGPNLKERSINLLLEICEGAISKVNNGKTISRKRLRLIRKDGQIGLGMDVIFSIIPFGLTSQPKTDFSSRIIEIIRDDLIRKMPYVTFGFLLVSNI